MKRLQLYILLLVQPLVMPVVFAQEQPNLREKAGRLYGAYRYAEAIPLYQKLAEKKKPRIDDLRKLADCYSRMNNYEATEESYARIAEDARSLPADQLRYAEALKRNTHYVEAKAAYYNYATKTGELAKVQAWIDGCDSALRWMEKPTTHSLSNQKAVNTAFAEFGAYPLGSKVMYVKEPDAMMIGSSVYGWTGNAFLQLYETESRNGELGEGTVAEASFNATPYHVGPVSANEAGTVLYVTRTHNGDQSQKEKEKSKAYYTRNLELYIYTKEGEKWREEPFAYNKVKEYSVGHAALGKDGKVLYFVSDMPGGQGGTDIWYCKQQGDGSWGEPQNAGATVNSAGNELFPSIGPDGTLYFSSDGHIGMGGLDVFRATGSSDEWSTLQNMRYPINSAEDDFAFVISSISKDIETGYLSSNRQGGVGSDDIYAFTFRNVEMANEEKDKVKDNKGATKADGNKLEKKTKAVTGLPLEKGKSYQLDNIHYAFDSSKISKKAAAILDGLVTILKDNPTMKIELSSHTDSRGNGSYNMVLSQQRAQAAVDYLVSKGIARDRMVAKGYGESRLLNHCVDGVECTEAEHQANRRTMFTILDF